MLRFVLPEKVSFICVCVCVCCQPVDIGDEDSAVRVLTRPTAKQTDLRSAPRPSRLGATLGALDFYCKFHQLFKSELLC